MAQKIIPNLWFDGNAEQAVKFYVDAFGDGEIINTEYYPQTAAEGLADFQLDLAGKVLTVQFRLLDSEFIAINAGPEFKPTPAVSFFVNFDPSRDDQAREHLDALWAKLSDGGEALMELGEYPFSKHYGWVKDKYGFSWQLILTNPDGEPRPSIIPSLLFAQEQQNKAEEAANYYVSVFDDAALGNMSPYGQDMGMAKAGSLAYGEFRVGGQWLAVMDNGGTDHAFTFNEAVSLMVNCKDQAEIDDLWAKLSAVPESEQCGWCKDKFGVSWQIVPENMGQLMRKEGAFAKLMQMKKIETQEF